MSTNRTCKNCGAELTQWHDEGPARFKKRVTCGSQSCRWRGRGQSYNDADRELVRRWYPGGGALAVWMNGWRYRDGGEELQLNRIQHLANRIKVYNDRKVVT